LKLGLDMASESVCLQHLGQLVIEHLTAIGPKG
jgi:hypothetical protein